MVYDDLISFIGFVTWLLLLLLLFLFFFYYFCFDVHSYCCRIYFPFFHITWQPCHLIFHCFCHHIHITAHHTITCQCSSLCHFNCFVIKIHCTTVYQYIGIHSFSLPSRTANLSIYLENNATYKFTSLIVCCNSSGNFRFIFDYKL